MRSMPSKALFLTAALFTAKPASRPTWGIGGLMRVSTWKVIGSAALVLFAAAPVSASPIELNSGASLGLDSFGEGGGRGIGVLMLSDFSLTSIGLQGDLQALSFDVQVYASTNGSNAGALLASASASLGGTGYQWWDIGINYNLMAGNYYVLLFRPTVSNFNNWMDNAGVGLEYFLDFPLPVDIGAFRLLDGVEGYTASDFGNTVHPDLRVNGLQAVPEPATLLLLGTGLGAVAARRRLKKRA